MNLPLDLPETVMTELGAYFLHGDLRGAIAYMDRVPALHDVADEYRDLFEKEHYRHYDLPENLDGLLLPYQQYYREIFYLGISLEEAEKKLFDRLKEKLALPNAEENEISDKMEALFGANGFHFLDGKTNGLYGPYIWKTTEPTTYQVEIPGGIRSYTVNLLDGFIFRSWMDYLTFGLKGTRGWASPDGTINCIVSENDITSEAFQVSLLKHEAQHVDDFERFPGITPAELEYRAKLVELIYSQSPALLEKFKNEADPEHPENSHAAASEKISKNFSDLDGKEVCRIQRKARELFDADTERLTAGYDAR